MLIGRFAFRLSTALDYRTQGPVKDVAAGENAGNRRWWPG